MINERQEIREEREKEIGQLVNKYLASSEIPFTEDYVKFRVQHMDLYVNQIAGQENIIGKSMDVGCGAGDFSVALALKGGKVLTIDNNPVEILQVVKRTSEMKCKMVFFKTPISERRNEDQIDKSLCG
jgi:2-polyprenyl-3-methyl-5-hydroxy-6-metoxy-1,4-benzoquinol methylase